MSSRGQNTTNSTEPPKGGNSTMAHITTPLRSSLKRHSQTRQIPSPQSASGSPTDPSQRVGVASNPLMVQNIVAPTVNEAADALFSPEEKSQLRENLIEEQIQHAKYLRLHPEIDHLLEMAIGRLVRDQPEDAVGYLTQLFAENDLEQLEAEYTAAEQRLHEIEREKHDQLANPEVFSLP